MQLKFIHIDCVFIPNVKQIKKCVNCHKFLSSKKATSQCKHCGSNNYTFIKSNIAKKTLPSFEELNKRLQSLGIVLTSYTIKSN